MNIVISGSRRIKSAFKHVEHAITQSGWTIDHITHGASGNVDQAASMAALRRKIPFTPVRAQWDNMFLPKVIRKYDHNGREYNAAAGMLRNEQMVRQVATDGGLIAVWDGKSTGTANCIAHAVLAHLPVFIYLVYDTEDDKEVTFSYHLKVSTDTVRFSQCVVQKGYRRALEEWNGKHQFSNLDH